MPSKDYLADAKRRIALHSDAEAYALIDIAESLRVIKEYITAPPIQFTTDEPGQVQKMDVCLFPDPDEPGWKLIGQMAASGSPVYVRPVGI
ncbi:hypothetical protein KIV65_gp59 [Mycobacterium phage Anthony]|uniref:Uncharacterized protein n=1 Tax=Mycobacterium phage Anthony TaxID=2599857 RepID=A0A5J6TKT7_9CAUD|nr:hypothetical protein KIV65_gp59 [Mycobacterium phage Anthony]QFG10409.1 hypothetical protein PBI_ANTHONY_38 [Mycobacterium phage Anthony]